MTIWYCTREDVQSSTETEISTGLTAVIDRAIEAASRKCEEPPLRRFYPKFNDTIVIGWPNATRSKYSDLYLNGVDIIDITTFDVAGSTLDAGDYVLQPVNTGPPYRYINIKQTTPLSFYSGDDKYTAITITGTTGYTTETATVGTITQTINTTATSVTLSGTQWGIGSLIVLGSEYCKVTGRGWVDTGDTLAATLTKNVAATTFTVSTATGAYNVGDIIRVDTEKMRIEDYDAGTFYVRRAVQGTALAEHATTATVETLTKATIARAQCGTTAAAHTTGDTLKVWQPPALIRDLCIAEAITSVQQTVTGYGRTVGTGDNAVEARGLGLMDVRTRARRQYRRPPVVRSVG